VGVSGGCGSCFVAHLGYGRTRHRDLHSAAGLAHSASSI